MTDWSPMMRKFDNALLREQVADLQRNPYLLVQMETKEDEDHPKTRLAAKKYVKEYTERCHQNAFIYGDTYEGMPVDEAAKIIMEEGFSPAGRTPENHIRFHHDYLAMGLTPRCDDKGKLVCIAGNLALTVNPAGICPESICGLGLSCMDLTGNTLSGDIDLTGGMKVKMFILRSWIKG